MPIDLIKHPVFRQFIDNGSQPIRGFSVDFTGQDAGADFGIPGHLEEEPFEWLALLEAVLDAHESFTMFELGAGYGRWLVRAACAARQKNPTVKLKFVAVEPEPTHFSWMRKHFANNALNAQDHVLIEAVVNARGEPVRFLVGHPEWYGQSVVPQGWTLANFPDTVASYPKVHVIEVPGVKLTDLLAPHRYVDLVDMDIQGSEQEVVQASIDGMTAKVRRAFVSTHSAQIHTSVARTFSNAGWQLSEIHGWTGAPEHTSFGTITFVDGVQYWINPHVARS
jgi:FkbM family methyltransferase